VTIRPLPLVAAAVILIATGLAHGVRTDRWRLAGELQQAAARLDNIPLSVEDWEGEPDPVNPEEVRIAQVAAVSRRQYVHQVTRERAALLLVCGRPGAVGAHTPDICFAGAGFRMQGEAARQVIKTDEGQAAEFWTATFTRPGLMAESVRVWWAWGASGEWTASDSPRLAFARYPAIYKLYVVSKSPAPGQNFADDPGRKFIVTMLPKISKALSSGR
jgi:hypothetical protein